MPHFFNSEIRHYGDGGRRDNGGTGQNKQLSPRSQCLVLLEVSLLCN